MSNLAYLAGMFIKINEINLLLQRKTVAVLDANAKVSALRGNFCIDWRVWKSKVSIAFFLQKDS